MIALPAMSPRTCTMRRANARPRGRPRACLRGRDRRETPYRSKSWIRGAGFACETEGYRFIDQAGAGGDRVGSMRLGAVALGYRGGNAALRPGPSRRPGQRRR